MARFQQVVRLFQFVMSTLMPTAGGGGGSSTPRPGSNTFKRFTLRVALVLLLLSFSACSGGGGKGDNKTPDNFVITPTTLEDIQVLTADNNPLVGAAVKVSGVSSPNTGIDGIFSVLGGLDAGDNIIQLTGSDGTVVSVTITVTSVNGSKIIKILVPLSSADGGITFLDVSADAVIASISGIIHSSTKIIPGASVSISGGSLTNGIFSTAITDENGRYNLLINVSQSLATALLNSTIIVSAEGYQTKNIAFSVDDSTTTAGFNLQLSEGNDVSSVLFHETFELDSPTVNEWATMKVSGGNANNMWHIHTSGENLVNQAYTGGYVNLAPNDLSTGIIPNPAEGNQAYWYGSKILDVTGSVQGNFLDLHDNATDFALSGGTSSNVSNSGLLTSPIIDLSNVTGELSLTFRTFWEIESVNPNANGYDVMTIETSDNGGVTWTAIAKLNPISDPASIQNRSSIPFSTTGFNSAPVWSQQELVPLSNLVGKSQAMIRFNFDTVDDLYNGFRGWFIDDVKIVNETGTFPTLKTPTGKLSNVLSAQSTDRRSRAR